jgi:Cu+-exporting ATPase
MSDTQTEFSLPISGMTCASCVSHVEKALTELPGVSRVAVNLATNKATLSLVTDHFFKEGGERHGC